MEETFRSRLAWLKRWSSFSLCSTASWFTYYICNSAGFLFVLLGKWLGSDFYKAEEEPEEVAEETATHLGLKLGINKN